VLIKYYILGFDFLESVLKKFADHSIKKMGFVVERQKNRKVCYEGVVVGNFRADIVVDELIFIELKFVLPKKQAQFTNWR